ncbi:hypothetical protein CEP52_008353 [Fusarium oligoseptatum]|uniref:Uncharacterized protein n=1 Tax=Fusarium oligoseptatum TaxID=2604345 RepID=A0A428TIE8_9HYPO|nr:hypothetical protein CEP52_008353 [Fusarium oligoseptatum]
MLFLYFLLWQVLSVGCLSGDTSTESEIVLFPFPSGSPIEAQISTASVEIDPPWSSEMPFTKVWNDDQEGVEESTTGGFFGIISTISLAPQTSLEDTWSTKTLTHEDEVVFPTVTLSDEDSETLSEPKTASETDTGTTHLIHDTSAAYDNRGGVVNPRADGSNFRASFSSLSRPNNRHRHRRHSLSGGSHSGHPAVPPSQAPGRITPANDPSSRRTSPRSDGTWLADLPARDAPTGSGQQGSVGRGDSEKWVPVSALLPDRLGAVTQ